MIYQKVSGNLAKTIRYIPLLTILSCNNQIKQTGVKLHADTTNYTSPTKRFDGSKYYTTKDTVFIPLETGDTDSYSKEEFNRIIDNHPEFFSDEVQDPDFSYNCADKEGFNSEVGQDGYYALYAYFLKQKNGVSKYAEQRKKLIVIFLNINALFQRFQHGGTYFGHQSWRILGYAEYSVYLYKNYGYNLNTADYITKQKDLYIKSLRQLIDDKTGFDGEIAQQDKAKRKKELNKIVDEINQAITDIFYLRRAHAFQYEHYEYYY